MLNCLLDRLDDIRIDEGEHGPPGDRRYTFTDSWILHGLDSLHLTFSAIQQG
jgi:hypothetical protein